MTVEEQVEEVLESVYVSAVKRSVMQMNLLRGIEISDDRIKITLSAGGISAGLQDHLTEELQTKLMMLEGVNGISVSFDESVPKDINRIKQVIAIMSGKGSVGKSLVSGLLALAIARQGNAVGILDADITGPSIPKMFGIHAHTSGCNGGMLPIVSRTGIEIMSINLLLPHEDDAVIWRGPLIGKCITQFWEDVLWGNLDYLIVDLPPGTADVPLTVMKSTPVSGVIIVFTPQDLTAMVVRKAANMARQMNVPILGVIENMSYFLVPETGNKVEIFGRSRRTEMADNCGAPSLGQIPLDPELARLCDEGQIEEYNSEVFEEINRAISKVLIVQSCDVPSCIA